MALARMVMLLLATALCALSSVGATRCSDFASKCGSGNKRACAACFQTCMPDNEQKEYFDKCFDVLMEPEGVFSKLREPLTKRVMKAVICESPEDVAASRARAFAEGRSVSSKSRAVGFEAITGMLDVLEAAGAIANLKQGCHHATEHELRDSAVDSMSGQADDEDCLTAVADLENWETASSNQLVKLANDVATACGDAEISKTKYHEATLYGLMTAAVLDSNSGASGDAEVGGDRHLLFYAPEYYFPTYYDEYGNQVPPPEYHYGG